MEKLAGDLLLGPKFVKLEILSTLLRDFLDKKLGELSGKIILNALCMYHELIITWIAQKVCII